MKTKSRQLFDMDACIQEKKHAAHHYAEKEVPLYSCVRIGGVQELSRFETRVALNEYIHGAPREAALAKAKKVSRREV